MPDPTAALDTAGVCYRPLIPSTLGVDLLAERAANANSAIIERSRCDDVKPVAEHRHQCPKVVVGQLRQQDPRDPGGGELLDTCA